jgi:hypothetical protein
MTISRNNGGTDSRLVKALVEQVSQIQEDIYDINANIASLDQTKADTNSLALNVATQNLVATKATIGGSTTINASKLYSPNVDASYLHSQNADFNYLHSNVGYIESLSTDGLTVNGVVSTFDLNARRLNVTETITVPEIGANTIGAGSMVVSGSMSANGVAAPTANFNNLDAQTLNVAQTLKVADLAITGTISGLNNVDVEANSITTPTIDAGTLEVGAIYTTKTSDDFHLVPTPHLDNNDHYTIMLPSFTGTVVLKWVDDGDNEVWSATVIGNGKDYEIHWGTVGETLVVQRIYQDNGHLYIRHNANGSLYYSYHTTDVLGEITVWYNYTALDGTIWDTYTHDCTHLSGTVSFGDFYVPSFTTDKTIFDDVVINNSLTVAGATNLNELSITNESIEWNGKTVQVCNNFTTDWIKD